MCGLCGMLGAGPEWTDAPHLPGQEGRPWRARQQERVKLANRVLGFYRLQAKDWTGTSVRVAGPTGRVVLVETLPQLWQAAERLASRPIDPLDPALLSHLDEG